jgi:hypothetical protein
MAPVACVNFHPFVPTLQRWESGVPVDCGPNWTWETIKTAVQHGAQQSAMTPKSIALIAKDVAYQVKVGYARIISWKDLQLLQPSNLKVSPLVVVPQWNRRG